jgi:hypothetical protein
MDLYAIIVGLLLVAVSCTTAFFNDKLQRWRPIAIGGMGASVGGFAAILFGWIFGVQLYNLMRAFLVQSRLDAFVSRFGLSDVVDNLFGVVIVISGMVLGGGLTWHLYRCRRRKQKDDENIGS